jgi:CHAD domain-containing protein
VNAKAETQSYAEASFVTFANPLVSEAIDKASALKKGADVEELHKLRVALRRLRTLLWAYRPMLDANFDNGQREILKSLATAAGNTRDWDILIDLIKERSDQPLLKAFEKNREETAKKSREALSNSNIEKVLRASVKEATRELETSSSGTPLKSFARKRVKAAQKQLRKRMVHADSASRSDYASYHEVRKAGKKVRYLIEFFDPLLGKRQRKGLKKLTRLQKRLGALNDVVTSRDLLNKHRASLPAGVNANAVLRALKKKQKRRFQAASKMF